MYGQVIYRHRADSIRRKMKQAKIRKSQPTISIAAYLSMQESIFKNILRVGDGKNVERTCHLDVEIQAALSRAQSTSAKAHDSCATPFDEYM